MTNNIIKSTTPDKLEHDWQQSITESTDIISRLTEENQVVLDPMVGSGTTAIATLGSNRKVIGIEFVEDTLNIAKGRIAKFLSGQRGEI
jgi:DNA modification methylase